MDKKVTQLNIQPQAGIIGVFSRLNYKPWYAIAEFVDNSTQSFYTYERVMRQNGITSINVDINYDFEKDILTIKDDAYGMEINDFHRAIKVDSIPENQGGRNEFGMGLKTAASWFGNVWSVESTQLGSTNKYYTEVNIDELRSKNLNSIDIINVDCDKEEHGTTIVINKITKKIDAGRTKGKIIKLLESMYRRDINSGKINITFNGERLKFEDYNCLNFRDKTWKKNVDFSFDFDGKRHRVTGFVGILEKGGGFGKAGFALFRRNRVVIGGEDQNYKPYDIFGQPQSQISLRLFGELNLDDFDINQAKDGLVWDNGLEDEFVNALKVNIQEYISIARISNKERASEESLSANASQNIQEEVGKLLEETSLLEENLSDSKNLENDDNRVEDLREYQKFVDESNSGPEIVLEDKVRIYPVHIDAITEKIIHVKWAIVDRQYWIDVEEDGDNINILININHPFFKPYSNDLDFKKVLEKFVIAFVVAEQQAKLTSENDGYIMSSAIRQKMNKLLAKMIEE